jgi:hypothetical protein
MFGIDSRDISSEYIGKYELASENEKEMASKIMNVLRESHSTILNSKSVLKLCYLNLEVEGTVNPNIESAAQN